MTVRSICGVILASREPAKLADFYASVLEVAFEREEHGDLDEHFGVDIGEVHFGIHPPANLSRSETGNASASLAFDVESIAEAARRVITGGGEEVTPPHDEGFGAVAAYRDPEGNPFELVELDYEFGSDGEEK